MGAWKVFSKGPFLLEMWAAILFFGSLVQQPELARQGVAALGELAARGYTCPADADPVRVYPALTGGAFDSSHAGGWRPGVISLRENPHGGVGPEVYLRHELMHEVSFRTCGGKLPIWAEEAAAMSFSGELSAQPGDAPPTSGEVEALRERIRIKAPLDAAATGALSKLIAGHGWPREPCAVSENMAKAVEPPKSRGETGFSAILISVASGRVLDWRGDRTTRYAPGSLLKIPYAASLRDVPGAALGAELAASDTVRLLKRRRHFDPDRYRLLLSPVQPTALGERVSPEQLVEKDETFWRSCLGERNGEGVFPLEANLQELAMVLRASLLIRPSSFYGLSRNGFVEGTTLYAEPEQAKRILKGLHALSKTGSTSDARGNPLMGHLMVAWPADDPSFLAVFRTLGGNGASNLRPASRLLEEWSRRLGSCTGKVRVRLLTPVPRDSWIILEECPSTIAEGSAGWKRQVSTCGAFRIRSSARGSRSERLVSGIIERSPDDQKLVLVTDPETYADAVLSAEAQDLRGEARKALRAVIVWNGDHGTGRHADTSSLCDTTHCMVFQGALPEESPGKSQTTGLDLTLLKQLHELAARRGLDWLQFSKGGSAEWERTKTFTELSKLVDEASLLDVRRERTRSGAVVMHLFYAEGEETVPCEVFRNKLKLPSCPEAIRRDDGARAWHFHGRGEGHSQGLSVERAKNLAESGQSGFAILTDAYDH